MIHYIGQDAHYGCCGAVIIYFEVGNLIDRQHGWCYHNDVYGRLVHMATQMPSRRLMEAHYF